MVGNCFIVTPWSQDVEKRRKTIKGIPILVNLFDVPKELLSDEGLGVVASRLGKPLQMDETTASKKRITFVRVCIEVEISSELSLSFEIEMEKRDNRIVRVEYSWVPKKCDNCKAFGHLTDKCFRVPRSIETATYNVNGRRRVWVQYQQEVVVEQEPANISRTNNNSANERVATTENVEMNQLTTEVAKMEENNGIVNNGSTEDTDVRLLQNLPMVPYVDSLEQLVGLEDSAAMAEFKAELVEFVRSSESIGEGELSEDVLSVEETP
ncbi:hypothetical protein IFM89_014226 [Coptis chinensis]|uniref:DUF4283 domain-containing protein n=1 Tax=Coptis chinensis TaxID=261450 RepID=A0A835H876_9MAGN|nr:hypothetical protein IFM89_014226 [Coptis chinensis]